MARLILIVLVIVGAAVGYKIYTTKPFIETNCLAALEKSNKLNIDAPGYCGCLGEKIGHHTAATLKTADGRRDVFDKGGVCFDNYLKPPLDRLCVEANSKMAEEHPGASVECGCFYTQLKNQFIEFWIGAGTGGDLSEEKKQETVNESLKQCLKVVG
jgi:hypothetical protein